jgi:hypothetical protein
MSVVLAVEPDSSQADVLRQFPEHHPGMDFVLVTSTAEAIANIGHSVPDVVLMSALLSPQDEEALLSHLRSLDGAAHLQTLTIPQFRHDAPVQATSRWDRLRRLGTRLDRTGCDPAIFWDEVNAYLARSRDVKEQMPEPEAANPAVVEPAVAEAPAMPADSDDILQLIRELNASPATNPFVAAKAAATPEDPIASELAGVEQLFKAELALSKVTPPSAESVDQPKKPIEIVGGWARAHR